jgi:hypothetical protein
MSLLVLSCFKPRACCSAACCVATEKLPARRVENIHAPRKHEGRPAYDVRRKSEPQSPGAWARKGVRDERVELGRWPDAEAA